MQIFFGGLYFLVTLLGIYDKSRGMLRDGLSMGAVGVLAPTDLHIKYVFLL